VKETPFSLQKGKGGHRDLGDEKCLWLFVK
jgi:hypothetical protein